MGELDERGSEKKGRRVERSKREKKEWTAALCPVEPCRLQFSQVSERLFRLILDLVIPFYRDREKERQLPIQN